MWYNSIRKVVDTMATRTANVTARVEPEIKEQAEAVMEKLGIPVSTAINMFYREIILWNGLPFRPSVPMNELKARDEMTKEEFDQRMSVGLAQAKEGMTAPAGKVYERLMGELGDD
jgi:DNA-damage-inducible protein J